MSRIRTLLFVALLLCAFALPVASQEATPDTGFGALLPVTDIVVEDGGSLTIEQPAPAETEEPPAALAVLLTMASSVAGLLELVKPGLARWKEQYQWSDELHTFVVRLAAFAAALVLIFLTPNDANVVTAWGLTLQLPLLLVKVATAFVISMGASIIWAGFRFLKLLPVVTAIVPVATIRRE